MAGAYQRSIAALYPDVDAAQVEAWMRLADDAGRALVLDPFAGSGTVGGCD